MKKNPPEHLKSAGASLYAAISDEYSIDDAGGLALLLTAAEALDRLRAAQSEIDRHGELIKDRFGQLKANPACAIERDCRRDFLASLKCLNLDLEPLRDSRGNPGTQGFGIKGIV